jgi:hypothetical protein
MIIATIEQGVETILGNNTTNNQSETDVTDTVEPITMNLYTIFQNATRRLL